VVVFKKMNLLFHFFWKLSVTRSSFFNARSMDVFITKPCLPAGRFGKSSKEMKTYRSSMYVATVINWFT